MRGGSSSFTASLGFESVFQQSLGDAMADGGWHQLVAGLGMDMADAVHQVPVRRGGVGTFPAPGHP
jgi:hypothetical protein